MNEIDRSGYQDYWKVNPNPEALMPNPGGSQRKYRALITDPYSLNIKDDGSDAGGFRFSHYSGFVHHAAREIIEAGFLDEEGVVVTFDDASFGKKYPSHGDLSFAYFAGEEDRPGRNRIIDPSRVYRFNGSRYARTPTQVKAARDLMRRMHLDPSEVLYLGWPYHGDRVEMHARAFGFEANFLSAIDAHKHLRPEFKAQTLIDILPRDEIEVMEAQRRDVARKDGRGYIPMLVQHAPIIGGPRMLDNKTEKNPDGSWAFDYRKPEDRIEEVRRMGIEPVKKLG